MRKILCAMLVLCLFLTGAAAAETVYMSGTVVSTATVSRRFVYGGTVSGVCVHEGDRISAGDRVYAIETEKVYASGNGTVRLFGEVGDDCTAVAEQYGAVAYIEPALLYTISANTSTAYDAESNRLIHPGERVYLRSNSRTGVVGTGRVTNVSGKSYTVEVLTGSFNTGETVNVFRSVGYEGASRIGRGSVAHSDPTAITGEGTIVSYAVADGDTVKKGDLLFETVNGTAEKNNGSMLYLNADAAGVVVSVSVAEGETAESGAQAYTFYPDSALRIEAGISESDLYLLADCTDVEIALPCYADGDTVLTGRIERISRIGTYDEETEQTMYTVYIIPDDISLLYYGMTAEVTTVEAE